MYDYVAVNTQPQFFALHREGWIQRTPIAPLVGNKLLEDVEAAVHNGLETPAVVHTR